MYIGIPNPNILVPLKKMTMENLDTGDKFEVLYNPQSYKQGRKLKFDKIAEHESNAPVVQYIHTGVEQLEFELFFDSLNAGTEVGGSMVDKAKFAANSLLPSIASQIDVRDYTKKVYELMEVEPSVHRPPMLKLEWASLQFIGFLYSCVQNFQKFNEQGKPVRAVLSCVFIQFLDPEKANSKAPLESPDTSKFRRVCDGDSLWALSAKEYGQCGQWRAIADANGLTNPRLLHSGDLLRLPALE